MSGASRERGNGMYFFRSFRGNGKFIFRSFCGNGKFIFGGIPPRSPRHSRERGNPFLPTNPCIHLVFYKKNARKSQTRFNFRVKFAKPNFQLLPFRCKSESPPPPSDFRRQIPASPPSFPRKRESIFTDKSPHSPRFSQKKYAKIPN